MSVPFGAAARARDRRLGRRRARPTGSTPVAIEGVVGERAAGARRPRALAGRLLRLDAGARARARRARATPKRRKVQAPPAERQSLAGEAAPVAAVGRAAARRSSGSWPAIDAGGGAFLLYGATGSGKTEVYLQACAAALERGLGAIVLVPEIALAPQTVGRVRARFGDRVAILHSGLTDAERRDERERIASGEARIVVGARSAVFAPVRGLGLIVVDEEHDASYKQDSDPRYDARTLAAKRAALEGAVAVFGSATPRPESWAAARAARARRPRRPARCRRCRSSTCAARPATRSRRRCCASCAASPTAAARRSCSSTAAASRPRCTAARAARRSAARTATSRSSSTRDGDAALPPLRPRRAVAGRRARRCGSTELARLGAGHAEARARAGARVPRARADPPRRRHGREARGADRGAAPLRRRRSGAVLLGTQMVAKGHHFAGVELAAVDRRRHVARAARLPRRGADVPADHPARRPQRPRRARAACSSRRSSRTRARSPTRRGTTSTRFLAEELERRRDLGYPPFRHLVRIVVSGPEPAPVQRALEELQAGLPRRGAARPGAAAAPARPPPRPARREDRAPARRRDARPRALLAAAAPAMRRAGLTAVVDVDPQSL